MATIETWSPSASHFSLLYDSTHDIATHDCITCATHSHKCDRRRPFCDACSSTSRQCEGFALDLVWKDAPKPKMSKTGASVAKKAAENSCSAASTQRKQRTKELKFVTAQVGSKRRKKTKAAYATGTDAGLFSKFTLGTDPRPTAAESPAKSPDSSAQSGGSISTRSSQESPPVVDTTEQWDQSSWSMTNPTLPLYGGFVFPPEQLPQGFFSEDQQLPLDACTVEELSQLASGTSPVSSSPAYNDFDLSAYDDTVDMEDDIMELLRQVPIGVTYQSLAHKYKDVLESYNTKYCVVPLSTDCPSNPYRVSSISIEKYPFLLHGVLAISSRHLAKRDKSAILEDQAHSHWSTSLRLLSTATYSSPDFLPLLDTVLVLANFESMQSAYNMVNMHLDGARKMIQEAGLTEWSHYIPRLRAQIAMLVWWDVTVSLVARRKPRLPSSYMEILVSYDGDESEGWSSFTLNGCPLPFIAAMGRLASLAAIYEQTKQMEHTMFDHSAVDTILKQVEEYTDMRDPLVGDVAGDANTLRNRHHCVEAWRHAILLYAQRVFKPAPDKEALHRIDHLSRTIFDSARCIPPTETLQKQVLLPMFLAAAEVGNEWNRDFAREFCRHWSRESNFDQFETVGRLLEEIWRGWKEEERDVYWWGVKVPAMGLGEGEVPMARMLQLG